jgi:hypothetical protein
MRKKENLFQLLFIGIKKDVLRNHSLSRVFGSVCIGSYVVYGTTQKQNNEK